jgi:hypothetical protein
MRSNKESILYHQFKSSASTVVSRNHGSKQEVHKATTGKQLPFVFSSATCLPFFSITDFALSSLAQDLLFSTRNLIPSPFRPIALTIALVLTCLSALSHSFSDKEDNDPQPVLHAIDSPLGTVAQKNLLKIRPEWLLKKEGLLTITLWFRSWLLQRYQETIQLALSVDISHSFVPCALRLLVFRTSLIFLLISLRKDTFITKPKRSSRLTKISPPRSNFNFTRSSTPKMASRHCWLIE